MFETPLVNFIDLNHELVLLSRKIEWKELDEYFTKFFSEIGRPSVPVRKIVGLLILKHVYNASDENVVSRWTENPYWQFFCGEVNFQKKPPFDPSEFVHFRKRIGKEGSEKILQVSIRLHGDTVDVKEVYCDTTVQEKNITFPTDTKLHIKIIDKCLSIAKKEKITLRQSYKRKLKEYKLLVRFRRHPKKKKTAKSAAKKIKTIAGRLTRELGRKLNENLKKVYAELLTIFSKILEQTQTSKNKIYSIHEPDVKCIAKGKEHKAYEFGNISSIAKTKDGIIVGAMAFEDNVFDGDTISPQLEQIDRLVGARPEIGIADRGYRGRKQVGTTKIIIPAPVQGKYQQAKHRRYFRTRAGIEPVIGHVKHDHRMERNYLKGTIGDAQNTMLAAAAFNIKKFLNKVKKSGKNFFNFFFRYIFCSFLYMLQKILKIDVCILQKNYRMF